MDLVNKILESDSGENLKQINVVKTIDVDIDEGTLLISDYNELSLNKKSKNDKETALNNFTRDNVQLLINKIWELPTKCVEETIVAELPRPKYVLPRARKVPKPKPLTKWQQFAKEKGIKSKKKGKSKLKWDDILQKWIPNHGFKKVQAEKQKEWLVECNDEGKPIEDPVQAAQNAKKERVAKNEFQRLRNIAKSKNIKVPKVGLPPIDNIRDSKQLAMGAKVAEISTASLGKFTETSTHEPNPVKNGKVQKKKKKQKKGQLKEAKTLKKPKPGKGNRDFRSKTSGRKRR